MSRPRHAHDPVIDTIEGSDDENPGDIIRSSLSQQQIEITAPTQDSDSLLSGYNGESIMDSGSLAFKKNSYGGNFGGPIEPETLQSFSIALDSLCDPPLPCHSKESDHFSVSHSLPTPFMELDSPPHEPSYGGFHCLTEPSDKEQKDQASDPNVKESVSGPENQSTDGEHDKSLSNGDFILPEPEERTVLCREVTFSESDLFASQPLTFGSEPKALKTTQSQADADEDVEDSTNGEAEHPSATSRVQFVSPEKRSPFHTPKRKRESITDPERGCHVAKRINLNDDPPKDEYNSANSSIEVIYDKKESQDIRLFLSENTQNSENMAPLPVREIIEEDWLTSHEDSNEGSHSTKDSAPPRSLDVSLPNLETPRSITPPEESESIFKKAVTAAQANLHQQKTPKDSFDSSPSQNCVPASQTPLFSRSRKDGNITDSQILAEDSEDEKSCKLNGSNHISVSQVDTEEELYMEKSAIRNINDLRQGNWNIASRIRKNIELVKWVNPVTMDVLYSISGDDFVIKDQQIVEKILDAQGFSSDSSKGSRVSNMSSTTMSSGYLGDKSSSTNPSINLNETKDFSRRSMASVIAISPPSKTLPPLFYQMKSDASCQTDSTDTEPIRPRSSRGRKPTRGRGRPKLQKKKVKSPDPILEESKEVVTTEEVKQEPPEDKPINSLADFESSIMKRLEECTSGLSEDDERIFLRDKSQAGTEQTEYIKNLLREVSIKVGMIVFARYSSDKSFYSGIVEKQDRADRWMIRYNLDNQLSSVREVYILPTEILPKTFRVFVRHATKDYCEQGIVRGHFFDGVLLHTIELLKGEVVNVPHSHIVLKENSANELLKARTSFRSLVSSPGCEVTWENIVEHNKRRVAVSSPSVRRRPVREDSNLDTTDDQSNQSHRKTNRRVKTVVTVPASDTETDSSVVTETPKTKGRRGATSKTPKAEDESAHIVTTFADIEPTPTRLKSKPVLNPVVKLSHISEESPSNTPTKRQKKALPLKTPKKTRKVEVEKTELFGPMPAEGSNIFGGYTIIITSTEKTKMKDPDVDEPPPLDREHLRSQFTVGGGTVLDSFDDLQIRLNQELSQRRGSKTRKKIEASRKDIYDSEVLLPKDSPTCVFCVSNTTCRTSKFIQALTLGIPVVNFQWIIACCRQGLSLNWFDYLLPAGLSLLTGNMMEQRVKGVLSDIYANVGRVVDILKGEKVYLATSSNPQFSDLWVQLLSTAQAQVFTMPPKGGNLNRLLDRNTSVVMADKSIPKEELARAEQLRIPVVSSEWYMQSLYNGCKLQYTQHPKFQYDAEQDPS